MMVFKITDRCNKKTRDNISGWHGSTLCRVIMDEDALNIIAGACKRASEELREATHAMRKWGEDDDARCLDLEADGYDCFAGMIEAEKAEHAD